MPTIIMGIAKRTAVLAVVAVQLVFYPLVPAYAEATDTSTPSTNTTTTIAPPSTETETETAPVAVTETQSPAPPPAATPSSPAVEPAPLQNVSTTPETAPSQTHTNTPQSVDDPISTYTTDSSSQDQNTTSTSSTHVTNVIPLTSLTGNADVVGNRVGGDATTGNANATSNLLNILQSQSNVLGQGTMVTFTADIQGNVVGDLLLDPGSLAVENPALGSANVRVTNATGIANLVDLNAQSGDANVQDNRVGGNATTGDAHAVANIVNLLNSVVTAGNSFFGTINIYGDLNGDILLPKQFLTNVIASNSIPTTTIDVPTEYVPDTNLTNNQAITNTVTTVANSGTAQVQDNRVGGNTTTGNATTKVTVLNLSNNYVIGSNTLLVFVNVQGEWVGLLMDAPTGSTAAALGGGLTHNALLGPDTNVEITNGQQITNQVTVRAQSGDATVQDNRVAGNAVAGNATASANIANVANTQFSLSNWFGMLFINVFGKWHGSFGINTAAGNPTNPTTPPTGSNPPQVVVFVPGGVDEAHVVHFGSTQFKRVTTQNRPAEQQSSTPSATATVTTTETLSSTSPANATANPFSAQSNDGSDESATNAWLLPVLGLLIAAVLLGIERFIAHRQQQRS